MNANGITVYFETTPQLLVSRLINEKHHRPVLNNIKDSDLKSFIEHRLKEREPFYNKAKIIIAAEDMSMQNAC